MKSLSLLGLFIFVFFAQSARAQGDVRPTLDSGFAVSGQTVIMGTWMWDIERNRQKRSPHVDLWWQQVNDTDQFLVPVCNSRLAVVQDADYYSLSASDLHRVRFIRSRVSSDQLTPGTVLALKTSEGNVAKIRVVGYREMHDMSFDDARDAWPGWSDFLLSRPNKLNYHLEIEWTLYSGETPDL